MKRPMKLDRYARGWVNRREYKTLFHRMERRRVRQLTAEDKEEAPRRRRDFGWVS